MAGNTIQVNLEVKDNGSTDQQIKKMKELNQETSKAAELSRRAATPRRAAAEMQEYTQASGVIGKGGASARDFASQAQGLGGLVRLYATVAANVFAATAAFNALKEAANTTNMVMGLNQLGAATGVALGSLSKQFVEATDGAISLREAMGSVAKASAAGLSSTQIIDIAKYAKTASQALGVDMADAVSRLTRGIVKLEPELLDELGLFTKIGPATEQYAAKIGKTAASLTDFERRQAFANAVLEEAKKKFGDIKLEANPYQKLEASIRNLSTAGLELINKVLIPLTNILSSNTTVLAGALGLIGVKLFTMAIPALTAWRSELVQSAKLAKEKAADINASFGEKFTARVSAKLQIPELEKDLQKAKADYNANRKAFLEADNNYIQKSRSSVFKALSEEKDLNENIKRIKTEINKKTDEGTEASKKHATSLQKVLDSYVAQKNAKEKLLKAENLAEEKFMASNLEEKARLTISKRAGSRAERLDILSQVGQNVESGGFRYALDELDKGIKRAADLSSWDKLRTRITGVFIAGAASVGVFMRALGGVLNIIALATAAYTLLSSVLSKNSEETSEFNSAIDRSKESIKTADAVLKKYGDTITTASINARANIFQQLGADVDELADKLEKLDKNANWFDRLTDSVAIAFGGGLKKNFAENVAKNWVRQIEQLPIGPVRTAVEERLKVILGAASTKQEDLVDAIAKQSNEDVVEIVREGNKAFDQQRIKQKQLQASTQGVAEALKETNLRAQELTQSLANTDPVSKLGASFVTLGIRLTESFRNIDSSIASIQDLVKDEKMLQLISPEAFQRIQDYSKVLPALNDKIRDYQNQISQAQQKLNSLEQVDTTKFTEQARVVFESEKAKVRQEISTLTVTLEPHQYSFRAVQQELNNIAVEAIRKGYALISKMADIAMRQGSVAIQKSLIQGLSGPGIANITAKLNIEELNLQKEQINITSQLNRTMIQNNILQERRLTQDSITKLEDLKKSQGGGLSQEQEQELQFLQRRLQSLSNLVGTKLDRAVSAAVKPGEEIDPNVEGFRLQLKITEAGKTAQTAQIDSKIRQEQINAEIQTRAELRAEEAKVLQITREHLGLRQQILDLQTSSYEVLNDQQIASKEQLQTLSLANDQAIRRQAVESEIANITDRMKYANAETYNVLAGLRDRKREYLGSLEYQEGLEKNILDIQKQQFKITNEFVKQNRLRQDRNELEILGRKLQEDALSNEYELLKFQYERGQLLPDEFKRREDAIKTSQVIQAAEDAAAQAAERRNDKLSKIREDRAKAEATGNFNPEDFKAREDAVTRYYQKELDLINQSKDAKLGIIRLNQDLFSRQLAYEKIFEDTFKRMEDIIVDFVKTGKLNFKSLISSFIEDLLRFEMQQQRMQFIKDAGGVSGMASWLVKVLGFGRPGTPVNPNAVSASDWSASMNALGIAKGAAFGVQGMVEGYAKGGMFTNNVVSQPTFFKFGRGGIPSLGVMGEAGPEAIMPLKRDNQGNLGIRGNQGNVEVIVNNYSSEKATAKETTDSRGNRRIEVEIGDIVAGQMSTPNSSVQQAMTNGFSTKPRMVRR